MNQNLSATAAVDKQSLRGFLQSLPEEKVFCKTVKREDYLLSAISQELEARRQFPVICLTDPDTGAKTVANVFADRENLKSCISNVTNVEQKAEELKELVEIPGDKAPVQEVILTGENVNVMDLPVFRHFEGDAGRYITSGMIFAKDPQTGRYNMSFHRMQLKGSDKIGISLHSRGDLFRYQQMAKEQGKDLEICAVIGCHPAYYITSASKIPVTQDDYSWAGAYMDEKPLVTKAKTVDLMIPAGAEYVLEGVIRADEFEDEGPFGEYTGYSTSRSTRNIFHVTAITHREEPIWQDLVPGYAWEHLLLSQFTKEIILLDKLKKEIPEVTALNMPKNGCHFHAYLSMKPKAQGQARQAMMLLFGLDLYLKLIIVVNDDVDVYNEEEVMWAVATHVQADRNVFVVPNVLCNRLDPSSRDGVSAKMGIDATGEAGSEAVRVTLPEEISAQARALIME